MKKVLIAALVVLLVGGYFTGNYFVNFALKRGADNSPPPATLDTNEENLKPPARPDFTSETWTLKSFDGLTLKATHFLPENETHRWAILIHGYGRDQHYVYDYAEEYLRHGYNVLTPDLRAAGESEGIYLTMGTFESVDVVAWAKEIVERDSRAEIIFHGISMGAATALMAAALKPENLVAVVEDCSYTSAYEMFTVQLEKIFGLPEFPIMPVVDVVSKIKTGAAISDAAPIKTIGEIKVPVLFIHGTTDELVPCAMLEELYAACNSPKEKFLVEGAGHADSKLVSPEKYFAAVFKFVDGFSHD